MINGVKTNIQAKLPVSYYLDNDGNLTVKYNDDSTENLGKLGSSIINGVDSITISSDGYYVINGIKTDIEAKLPAVYYLDSNGNLIVQYVNGTTENLGQLGDSLVNGITSIEISDDGYYVVNGVKTGIVAINIYTVSFNTGFNSTVPSQRVKDGYKVEKPSISRTGYTLDGWFCNDEEWRFNSDVVKNDMILKAEWTANTYTVSFINEKGTNPEDITVTYDSTYELPTVESLTGYTFNGWYYNNTKVDSAKWNIASNVTLTAKWTANKNTITLDANGGSVSKTSVTVTYGEDYTLPVPTNTYGVFTGWLYNNEPITDASGNSLEPWTFTTNITATVDWTVKISSYEDLLLLNTYKNAEFELINDIDLTGKNWTPVGTQSEPFTGKLNGNGKTIKGLSFDTSSQTSTYYGLFGFIKGGEFSNIIFEDFSFVSENISKSYYVGALFGSSYNSETAIVMVDNVIVKGSIVASKQSSSYITYLGGISGSAYYGVYTNCKTYVSISEGHYVGGINAYSLYGGVYQNCYHEGDIVSSMYAGGIFGYNYMASNCECCGNKGNIVGVSSAGGIGGSAGCYAEAKKCFNYGNVTSTSDDNFKGAGGIFGAVYEIVDLPSCTITDSYNRGNITAPYAGGSVGPTYNVTVKNCYNTGSISGSKYSANIYAFSAGKYSETQCLGAGSISGGVKSTIGCGLVNGSSLDCYYSSTGDFYKSTGTYTSKSRYGSDLYKNDLYWTEYDSTTKKGTWVFDDSGYPTLGWELSLTD